MLFTLTFVCKAFHTVSLYILTDKLMSQTTTETAEADYAMAYQCIYRLEDKRLECCTAERDLGGLVDGMVNVSQQCALVAKRDNSILGCIKDSIANQSKEVTVPIDSA